MVKLAQGVVLLNGTFGKDIARYDRCHHHIQAKPRKPFRNTDELEPQQIAFIRCKNAWCEHTWKQLELDLWWFYCYAHPQKNKKGEVYYWHPALAFFSVNIKRVKAGKPIIYVPEKP